MPNIESIKLKFNPPSEYRGVKWYCDNNLVYEATPFFENSSIKSRLKIYFNMCFIFVFNIWLRNNNVLNPIV